MAYRSMVTHQTEEEMCRAGTSSLGNKGILLKEKVVLW